MPEDFNRDRFFDNIAYLIKKNNLKIGELESSAGVSAGYISRASKDDKSRPGVEFVMKVAELLGISVDTLLRADLTNTTPTEKYLLSFLGKLNKETIGDKLEWTRESKDELNRMEEDRNGNIEHPLFSVQTFEESNEFGEPVRTVTRIVFVSHNFDCHTVITNDCYCLRMKNGTFLHIMSICKPYAPLSDPENSAIEIWMTAPRMAPQFLCDNKGDMALTRLIEGLYATVSENMRHPKISSALKYVIDSFMENNDLEDDPPAIYDEEIPF